MNFMSEDDAKYFKEKNDETYVAKENVGDVTMLEEKEELADDDLVVAGEEEAASLFKVKVANFINSIKTKLLGTTDISSIGDGTVTGAINANANSASENAENIVQNKEAADSAFDDLNKKIGDTDISSVGDGTVTGAISANAKGVSDNAESISDNAKNISQNADDIAKNKEETDTAIEELSKDVDEKYDELNSALAQINSSLALKSNVLSYGSYVEADNLTIAGDDFITGSISASKSGYTPVAIAGVNISNASTDGVNNSRCYINRFYIGASGDISYQICNRNTSAEAKIRVRFYVLYVAN